MDLTRCLSLIRAVAFKLARNTDEAEEFIAEGNLALVKLSTLHFNAPQQMECYLHKALKCAMWRNRMKTVLPKPHNWRRHRHTMDDGQIVDTYTDTTTEDNEEANYILSTLSAFDQQLLTLRANGATYKELQSTLNMTPGPLCVRYNALIERIKHARQNNPARSSRSLRPQQ